MIIIRDREVKMRQIKDVATTGRVATKGDDAITRVKCVDTKTAPIGTPRAAFLVALV